MEKNSEVRIQNTEERITAETQRSRENNVGAALCGRPGQPRRVAPTKINLLLFARIILILCMAVFISACPKLPDPVEPSKTISFSGSSSGYNVYMQKNNSLSTSDILAIDVKADSVSNVFGAAFDIDFDSTKMTYSSYSAGSFLETGGNSVSYQ